MTKRVGFLDKRLGTIVVYCNRAKTSGLWYVRDVKGANVPLDSPSFQSEAGGMRGLQIYEVNRGGKDGLKLGLILEGEDNQTYKFETSLDTAFARGMLWAIAHMSEEDIRTGQIGINPTPADPAKTESDNAESILYCNMFVNGVEQPYLPKGQETDWQQVAQMALSLANRCEYPIAQVPQSGFFLDQNTARKTSQQPARQTTQGRSGVSYPQQPLKMQQTPANNAARPASPPSAPKPDKNMEELDFAYTQLMDYVRENYETNGMMVDEDRMARFIERAGAPNFDGLTIGRKHQVITTLALGLIEAQEPTHESIGRLKTLVTPKVVDWEAHTMLSDLLMVAFVEINPQSATPPSGTPPIADQEIPF